MITTWIHNRNFNILSILCKYHRGPTAMICINWLAYLFCLKTMSRTILINASRFHASLRDGGWCIHGLLGLGICPEIGINTCSVSDPWYRYNIDTSVFIDLWQNDISSHYNENISFRIIMWMSNSGGKVELDIHS